MRRLIALLLLVIPLSAFADDLQTALDEVPSFFLEKHDYDDILMTVASRPKDIMIGVLRKGGKADDVVRALRQELKISTTAARAIAGAEALGMSWNDPDPRVVDALHREAVRLAPKCAPVVAAYVDFMAHNRELYPDFAAAALPYTRTLSAADVASFAELLYDPNTVIVAADALRSAPGDRGLLEALTTDDSLAIRAAFIDPRWSPSKAADLIETWISLDRPADALAVADAFPFDERARLNLALAAAIVGDRKRAEDLLASAKVPDHDNRAASTVPLIKALLDDGADPYEALAAQVKAMRRDRGTWATACVLLARRGGYDRFAEVILESAARISADPDAEVALRYLPKPLADRLRAQMTAAPLHETPHGIDTPVAARLRAPRIVPFIEHARTVAPLDCSEIDDLASQLALPPGLAPIRLERHGEEIAGVAVAQTLDPVGELGLGGYWIVHSSNGGRTWDEPLYTGLRQNMPYVVLPASRMTLFDDDALYIEVEVHELDLSSITFPPIGLRSKRDVQGLYLEVPWSALRRDSDADGLTDLVEERLVTDPNDADSDDDGIADDKDGLPQVTLTAGGGAESEVLAELLKNVSLGGGALIVGLPATQQERQACVVRASRVGLPSLFVVADRAQFSAIDLNRRVVILSPAEQQLYEQKFGPSFFGSMEYSLVRRDGKKAVIFLDEGWAGNVYELEKTDKGWQMDSVMSYIT